MKTLRIECNWETQLAQVQIKRLCNDGRRTNNTYEVGRFAASADRILQMLNSESHYYENWTNGGLSYYYKDDR